MDTDTVDANDIWKENVRANVTCVWLLDYMHIHTFMRAPAQMS